MKRSLRIVLNNPDGFYNAVKNGPDFEFTTFVPDTRLPAGWHWCTDPSCTMHVTDGRHAHRAARSREG